MSTAPLKKEDFVSGQEVRWCPGCGDYSILATMQRTLAKLEVARENHVFISGIGCSSRFPYYMNTYGFHTIHGRAPTIASGLRCINPNLQVWVITGDGDGLSIGGNHLVHCMRRNVNLNILLVNNQIYGLTKGQYSPTSEIHKKTKSTPYGSIDYPINALRIAIASEATFVARTADSLPTHMGYVLERAAAHRGISFVEILQNCIVFNDKAFGHLTGREFREDRMVFLEHGKPLVFGKKQDKVIRVKRRRLEIVDKTEAQEHELLIHDENDTETDLSYFLTTMNFPDMPLPFGVFRAIQKPTYDDMLEDQIQEAITQQGEGDLKKLIYGSSTWEVT